MKSRFVKTNAKPCGFTLIEVMMAVMLIGLAIVSLVASSGAFTRYNAMGVDLSTAEFLIEEIRELTAPVAFADLGAYGQTYSPPRDANGDELSDFNVYKQVITIEYANPADLAQQPYTTPSDFRRVTVKILKNNQQITSSSWIRAKY